jgi:hypothetical protein
MSFRKPFIKTRKQSGMTLIGFAIVLAMVIFVSYIGMRIGPVYMEYWSVVSAMNGVASERGSANLPPNDIRAKVLNRLYVSYSANVKNKHIKLTRGNGVQLRIAYEVRTPMFGNLDIIAHFDRSVRLSN